MDNSESDNRIVLSVTEVMDNKEYILVRFKEFVNNHIEETMEKGIKDEDGDIKEFVPFG